MRPAAPLDRLPRALHRCVPCRARGIPGRRARRGGTVIERPRRPRGIARGSGGDALARRATSGGAGRGADGLLVGGRARCSGYIVCDIAPPGGGIAPSVERRAVTEPRPPRGGATGNRIGFRSRSSIPLAAIDGAATVGVDRVGVAARRCIGLLPVPIAAAMIGSRARGAQRREESSSHSASFVLASNPHGQCRAIWHGRFDPVASSARRIERNDHAHRPPAKRRRNRSPTQNGR